MAMMFNRFEIQGEISKSETASIYKALDTETAQVVALKTQSLESLGDRATLFVETLITEGESTRELAGQNIVVLYGAGEIEGQFCAAMEYIQGNSVATMIARKEGFSIWDLLDITRQAGAALEKAGALGVVHSSLEPAKIMVQWDGLVKVLGYGISNMSLIAAESGNGLGRLMPYSSPEQIRGEAMDQRSNIYTLGTILYEMVTGKKPFSAADPVALLGQIENEMPADPAVVNPKLQPAVSALIMKALEKDPAARYQSARELVEDLERCKESGKKAAAPPKKASGTAVQVDAAARAAAAAKFVSAAKTAEAVPPARPPAAKPAAEASVAVGARVSRPAAPPAVAKTAPAPATSSSPQTPKAAAAAAGQSSAGVSSSGKNSAYAYGMREEPAPVASSSADSGLLEGLESGFNAGSTSGQEAAVPAMSAATLDEEIESPKVAVDPMMSGDAQAATGPSFSDLDELPPLKEPVFTPPAPEPEETTRPAVQQVSPKQFYPKEEKPKVQPREVAQKAIKEIATIPPRLMLFSILGAVAVILVIAVTVFFRVHNEDDGSTAAPKPVKKASEPAPTPAPAPVSTVPQPAAAPTTANNEAPVTVRQIEKHTKGMRQAPAPVAAVVPGQALIDSTPQGAQFQVDGKSDPSWVTPFNVTGLSPGKHVVAANRSGYNSDIRSVDIVTGGKSSLVLHLTPVNALVVVNSTPAGAEITLDGRPTGRVTPAQFAVEKGTHTVVLKKDGFLDETTTVDLGAGQNFQFGPALRALGNAEEIRTVGKFKKLFGNGKDSTAGMGGVSIHTQPKGAQVAINQHMLDKFSPVEVMMGPGNYVVDITLTGFKPVHKVITVEKGGKVAIDEILERQ